MFEFRIRRDDPCGSWGLPQGSGFRSRCYRHGLRPHKAGSLGFQLGPRESISGSTNGLAWCFGSGSAWTPCSTSGSACPARSRRSRPWWGTTWPPSQPCPQRSCAMSSTWQTATATRPCTTACRTPTSRSSSCSWMRVRGRGLLSHSARPGCLVSASVLCHPAVLPTAPPHGEAGSAWLHVEGVAWKQNRVRDSRSVSRGGLEDILSEGHPWATVPATAIVQR